MFTIEDRDRIRDHVLALADAEPRVVAGAVVGSMALTDGDRWSDLDLTFAVSDDASIHDVIDAWTSDLVSKHDAVHLFDVTSGASLYRVFLLPGCLQVDLSVTPASKFGARGPKFRLLFGATGDDTHPPPPDAATLLGHAVHHALRARFCIERGRFWHAEYWLHSTRDCALHLACLERGLPARHGRGFDDLPAEDRAAFQSSFARDLSAGELHRALAEVIGAPLDRACDLPLAAGVAPQLRELAHSSKQ